MPENVEESIDWNLVPAALILLILSITGFFSNLVMFICFLREKSFHSTCHCLIALNCLADFFHLSGNYPFIYHVVFVKTCSQEVCYWIMLPTLIGIYASGPLIVEIGIDRLLACKWPVLYRSLKLYEKTYTTCHLIFPAGNAIWFALSSYNNQQSSLSFKSGKCGVAFAMSREVQSKFTTQGVFLNIATILIYITTYLQIRKLRKNSQMKSVFKSIACTVCLVLVGWSSVTFIMMYTISTVSDPILISTVSYYAGLGVNFACSCNAFVFYCRSKEYRQAIRSTLGIRKKESDKAIRIIGSSHAASDGTTRNN